MRNYSLIFGDSHAIQFGMSLGSFDSEFNRSIEFLDILDQSIKVGEFLLSHHLNNIFLIQNSFEKVHVSLKPEFYIEFENRKHKYANCIISLDNNLHNFFFTVGDNSFDFFDESTPHLTIGSRIVPKKNVIDFFHNQLALTSLKIQVIRKILPDTTIYFLECPPPIPSIQHIKRNPEALSDVDFEPSEKFFRLKIHKIFSKLQNDLSNSIDAKFIKSTPDLIDNDGFLLPQFWHGCTHANTSYYKILSTHYGLIL